MRKKIGELKDKETGLLQKYTKEWPEVQQVEAQITQLEVELKKAPPAPIRRTGKPLVYAKSTSIVIARFLQSIGTPTYLP